MKGRAAVLLALLGSLLLPVTASGHAAYLRSEPGSRAVVAESPARVDIWFTQELFRRQGENRITVTGPEGQPVQVGDAQIDDEDRAHLWVDLQPSLPPGEYRVDWRSLSAEDGDPAEGSFTFTLDPQASATSTPMGAQTAAASPPAGSPTSPAGAPRDTQPPGASSGGTGCLGGLFPAAGLAGVGWILHQRRVLH